MGTIDIRLGEARRWKIPYVGPKPIEEGEPFFGRAREVQALFDSLTSQRIVVLLSASGAGKSSLINAGLIPKLRDEGFHVVGKFRVGSEDLLRNARRGAFVGNLLGQWNDKLDERVPLEKLKSYSLAEFAKQALKNVGPSLPVLILDQFEEVVRSSSQSGGDLRMFFRDLGELLSNPRLWALISIREDFLGALEPYREYVPSALSERQRLGFLSHDQAMDAITVPMQSVEGRPIKFHKDAADLLATRLSMTRRSLTMELVPGSYVEPMILQVVCKQLWERLDEGVKEITEGRIPDEKHINRALAEFYEGLVDKVSLIKDAPQEGTLRGWFEFELMDGLARRQTQTGPTKTGKDKAALKVLVDGYVLRSDVRGDATWYELVHDRLVEPIRESNRQWRRSLPFQQDLLTERAEDWTRARDSKRGAEYLLSGEDLDRALDFAKTTRLPPAEANFLDQSLRERDLWKVKFSRRNLIIVFALSTIVAVVGSLLWRAAQERTLALSEAQHLSLAALLNSEKDPEYSLLLALSAALRTYNATGRVAPEAKEAINAALDGSNVTLLEKEAEEIRFVKFDERRPFTLVTWSLDGQVKWWDTITGEAGVRAPQSTNSRLLVGTLGAPFSYVNGVFAEAGNDNTIAIIDGDRRLPPIPDRNFFVHALALNKSGDRLSIAGGDGEAELWQIQQATRTLVRQLVHSGSAGGVRDLYATAFSDDGKLLATAGSAGVVSVWDGRSGRWLRDLTDDCSNKAPQDASTDGPDDDVYQLSFGRDPNHDRGYWLAAAGKRGFRVWGTDRNGGCRLEIHMIDNPQVFTPVFAIAIDQAAGVGPGSRTTPHIATAGLGGLIQVWDSSDLTSAVQTLRGPRGTVYSLSFSADGSRIASGGEDRTARIWELNYRHFALGISALNAGATRLAVVGPVSVRGRAEAGQLLSVWSLDNQQPTRVLRCDSCSRPVFAEDGTTLVVPSNASFVYNSQIGFTIANYQKADVRFAYSAALDSDGTHFAILTPKGILVEKKFDPGYLRRIDDVAIRAVGLAPDGSQVAFGCADGSLHLVPLKEVQPTLLAASCRDDTPKSFKIEGTPLLIRFCPRKDALHVAMATAAGKVAVWDLGTPERPPLPLLATNLRDIAFGVRRHSVSVGRSEIVELVGIAAQDGIAVYDMKGRQELASPAGSRGTNALAFDSTLKTIEDSDNESAPAAQWQRLIDAVLRRITQVFVDIGVARESSDDSTVKLVTIDDNGRASTHLLDDRQLIFAAVTNLTRPFSDRECQYLKNQHLFKDNGCLIGLDKLIQALRESRAGTRLNDAARNLHDALASGNDFNWWYQNEFGGDEAQAVRSLRARALVERALVSLRNSGGDIDDIELDRSEMLVKQAGKLMTLPEQLVHPLAVALLSSSQALAKEAVNIDQVERALDYYGVARRLDPSYFSPAFPRAAWDLNNICWYATVAGVKGAPELVLPLCDEAVKIVAEPKKRPAMEDSRGLARACLGDTKGAAADFTDVVAWKDFGGKDKETRQHWLSMLTSEHPQPICTDKELAPLRKQYQSGQ